MGLKFEQHQLKEIVSNGKTWNKEAHKYFPVPFRERVATFIRIVHRMSFELNHIFPKPLVQCIVNLSLRK